MVLHWEEDDQTIGGLCERLCLESSTLTPMVKRLEGLGYVGRSRDPADERQVRVRLTASGRAMREKARGIPLRIAEASGLDRRELERLKHDIVGLRDALEAYRERRDAAEGA